MTIDFDIDEKDIVKKVNITASPIEYLIIGVALKQFAENHNDIEIVKQMRKVIENHGNNDTNQSMS